MAERYTNKPDPAIRKNVRQARTAAQAHTRNGKIAHASVVTSSLVATLLAWAMFSSQDAQIEAAAKSTPEPAAITLQIDIAPVPADLILTR
ncbi:MAG TPA: hypothetical protein VM409_04650 [Chloroflexia bacterium]|nr:hypothetical protein [Chloroflexia bacterium]